MPPTRFYVVRNHQAGGPPLQVGLAQPAAVNGEPVLAPVSAISLPYLATTVLEAVESLAIFTAPLGKNGTFVERISADALAFAPGAIGTAAYAEHWARGTRLVRARLRARPNAGYALDVQVDVDALSAIDGGAQRVVLVKTPRRFPPGAHSVVWLVLPPVEQSLVSWSTGYRIYASATAPQPGAVIAMNALTQRALRSGSTYILTKGHFRSSACSSIR